MIEKDTGKIIHIDFGDCFEVAMHRERYPEKIPFRLTRMLIHSMEVCGIEGIFRTTCESVMTVLRDNKDSLMAMLEAFVYDPLINWRLFGEEKIKKISDSNEMIKSPRGSSYRDKKKLHIDEYVENYQNKKALSIIERIENKLTGKDFENEVPLDVSEQVNKLIEMATSTAYNSKICKKTFSRRKKKSKETKNVYFNLNLVISLFLLN